MMSGKEKQAVRHLISAPMFRGRSCLMDIKEIVIMKIKNHKLITLGLSIGLFAMSWVGSAMGFPGITGMWQGFHADEKGYPGPTQTDQNRTSGPGAAGTSSVEILDTGSGSSAQGYMPYGGFGGATQGSYPGHRPNGQ